MTAARQISVIVADDHAVVREGLIALLAAQPDIKVIGSAANGREALEAVLKLQPEIVIMDIAMPQMNGIEATREIRRRAPQTRVLILSMHASAEHVFHALEAGACGYLLKESAANEIVGAVRAVAAGQSVPDPAAARAVTAKMKGLAGSAAKERAAESLSSQEKRVLALVADGKTNKEIAAALGLSDKTVKNYLGTIFRKLQVSRRAHAAVIYRLTNPQ